MSSDEYIDSIVNEYEEIGEDLIIWRNGIIKRSIKDYTDEELNEWTEHIRIDNKLTKIQQNSKFSMILEDALSKRRYKRILCIIKKLRKP